jgi:two-component system, chemotaxis family, response regulator Rcp1
MNPTDRTTNSIYRDPVEILIVEDNTADLMIMQEALLDTWCPANVHTASNGEEAMKFLRRIGDYSVAPRPHIILLDLNMPRKNGHEVLQEIKSDRLLMRIPVVVLTTSQTDDDISRAYAAHANCYIRKPVDFRSFCDVMRRIESFWFGLVSLPGRSPTTRQAPHSFAGGRV